MLRLAPPGLERFLQSPQFVATFGGGEANVAVAVAQFRYAGRLCDRAASESDRRRGYRGAAAFRRGHREDRARQRTPGNLLPGGGRQPAASKVVYDRDYSAIALAKPGDIAWDTVFQGAAWFHITGITPAISASAADLALESVRKAKAAGLKVSCDLNYRKNLWKYGKPAAEVMRELVKSVAIAIANEEDVPDGARDSGRRGCALGRARSRVSIAS